MKPVKTFPVFGEPVEVLVPSEDTRGAFSMIVQTSPPGGGPPPHRHDNEDELFRVLEGDFELFDGQQWHKVPEGEYVYTLRGSVHTFRNCGKTQGRMQCIIVPGGLERYLEELSKLQMPGDVEKVMQVSAQYGIRFVTDEAPQAAPV